MSALLTVEGLDVSFASPRGPVNVLRNVSMDVGRARIVGLVGESGSGKSTLALAILGLLPANLARFSGRIELEGRDLTKLSPAEMRAMRGRDVSMIFQDPMTSLNPVFSVRTQMIDVQRAKSPKASRRALEARAVEMLDLVGIPDAAQRIRQYPHQFSGGMRQRIMIAMALLTEQRLLIADEPTTALDVTIEAQIVRLLRRLRSEMEVSILFVSHGLGLVSEICDDLVVMYAGTVVEAGPAARIFADPAHPYTQALLECERSVSDEGPGRLVSIPGRVADLVDVPQGCIFADRCPHVMPVCRQVDPGLRPVAGGQVAACHLVPGS